VERASVAGPYGRGWSDLCGQNGAVEEGQSGGVLL
jgi:hypothetical protein